MKRYKPVDFLCVVVFVGILLSFMLYLTLGIFLTSEKNIEEDAYPLGHSAADDFRSYNALFYEDVRIRNNVRELDYKLFRHVENDEIIVGNGRWLFATNESGLSYNYLLDYIGGHGFSDAESAKILASLEAKKALLAKRGAEFMVVVVPNSMTVYGEYVPSYLGDQSENTRLAVLESYLSDAGFDGFYNLTEAMREKMPGAYYFNNTENSLTALGAVRVYQSLMSLMQKHADTGEKILKQDEMNVTTRLTDGRSYAKRAGLENIIRNVTISFTGELQRYELQKAGELLKNSNNTVTLADGNVITEFDAVLEYSTEWDKVQFMPLLSNTFRKVTYKSGYLFDASLFEEGRKKIVIQLIHENELELLLDPAFAQSFGK